MPRVSTSPSHLDPILDVIFVNEDEDTYEKTLVPRKHRVSLAKEPEPNGPKSLVRAQSNEAELPTLFEVPLRRPVVANYLRPLIYDLNKEKMEDLSEYCLFNEGMHAYYLSKF
ncbi:hypothetical protein HAX54_041821 [Datura stramonium]|uniref:Uncharacterized protein n=1 Tax=Datura stramonium TaxID=4076 RepID=A0ABS8W2J5_DATST|nr:hypothetical protein [Datura stramonium]